MKIWFIVCGWYYNKIDEFYNPLKQLELENESINVFWSCHREPTDYVKKNFKYKNREFKSYHIHQILNNEFYVGVLKNRDERTSHNYDTIVSKRLFNLVK